MRSPSQTWLHHGHREEIAMEQIQRARGNRHEADPLPAAKEICDRTEGGATQRIAEANNGPVKVEVVWVKKGLAGEGEDDERA